MRFPQYLAHFSLLLNLQTSKFWQKKFCTDQLANLGFPEEIDNRMKTLEKYDLSKLMQNLYVMNWAKLIWPLCGWGWVLIKHVVKMFEKLKQLKIWEKYESEIGGRCCGFIKGGQQCGIWAVERERGEDRGGRGGGRGMAGPLLQMRGSRHRLPLLKRPSLLLCSCSPLKSSLRRIRYQVCSKKPGL